MIRHIIACFSQKTSPETFIFILEYLGTCWVLMCEKQWIFGFLPERWSPFWKPTGCLPSHHETNQARTLSKNPSRSVSWKVSKNFIHRKAISIKNHLSLAYPKVEMYSHFESGCSKNFTWYPFVFPPKINKKCCFGF